MPVTTIWTALPHGVAGAELRLSAVVSFRITTAGGHNALLSAFPDIAEWPASVAGMTFTVDLGSTVGVPAMVVSAAPSPALWHALFPPGETVVRSHAAEDHSTHPLSSFSVRANQALLRALHTQVGLASPASRPFWHESGRGPGLLSLLQDWTFSKREALRLAEAYRSAGNDVPAQVHLARLVAFYARDPDTGTHQVPLPTRQELRARFDFHKIIASLGDYPVLGRPLGLVIDLTVPRAAFPVPPAHGPQPLRVHPAWSPRGKDVAPPGCPATATWWDGGRFEMTFADGEITGGYLPLQPGIFGLTSYDVVEVDVDGAVLKTVGFANNLAQLDSTGTASTDDTSGPPSTRAAGLSLVQTGRSDALGQRLAGNAADEAALAKDPNVLTFTAEQLVRGYRLDVWDTTTRRWHSLMARDGHYRFAADPAQDHKASDESFVQLGVASKATQNGSPAPTDTLYVHESIARWDGWSLAAPRPGLAVSHQTSPTAAPEAGDATAGTTSGLSARFTATPGTLPRLRFGVGYRIRARLTDLSGDSLPVTDPTEAYATGPPVTYRRYEPVAAPVLVLRRPLGPDQPGESLERLVIRTRNVSPEQDGDPAGPPASRHVAPPRTSVGMAETLGALDGPDGRPRGDAATYAMLSQKDAGHLPTSGPDPEHQYPTVSAAAVALPYLPDPLARAAALRDLPGTTGPARLSDTPGGLVVTPMPGTSPRPGSVTIVRYGAAGSWPDVTPFQLVLAEGPGGPTWDDANRVLRVRLPKAAMATAPLSSVLNASDLSLMGVWEWLREAVEPGPNLGTRAVDDQQTLDALVGLLSQLSVEGGLWQLTPSRQVTFVHAVQQPLGLPAIQALSGSRGLGDTFVNLSGVITVHSASTAKVDLLASWTDTVDDPRQPRPSTVAGQGMACELVIDDPAGSPVLIAGKVVGQLDAPDRLVLGYPEGTPYTFPRHEMHDTRHRVVSYTPVSASRFRDYFAPDESGGFSRAGPSFQVDVPSSRHPEAPRLLYVVPAFGWQREDETNLRSHLRSGGSLRIYLERPWFSSGAGEQLAVVLWADTTLPAGQENVVSRYVTTWGRDPIYASPWDQSALPHISHFPRAARTVSGVAAAELRGHVVSVAAHDVAFDPDRRLWYADIAIDAGHAYHTFVRLALARYQEHAVAAGNADARLSPILQADFAALPMDRALLVSYDPGPPDILAVTVSGHTYTATADKDGAPSAGGSYVEVSVQHRVPGISDPDLCWQPVSLKIVPDVNVSPPLLWHGHVTLPGERAPGEYRLVIREFETLLADPAVIRLDRETTGPAPQPPTDEARVARDGHEPPTVIAQRAPFRPPARILDPVPTPRLVYVDTMIV